MYGIDWKHALSVHGLALREMGDELRGDCPFCGGRSRDPFCVNARSGVWFCHMCQATGTGVGLIADLLSCSYDEALRILKGEHALRYSVPPSDEKPVILQSIEFPKEYRPLDRRTKVNAAFWDYAASRGIDERLIRRYRIGYAAHGKYAWRLIVPVYVYGYLLSFVARDITGTLEPKVLTPVGNHQSRLLFNLDNVYGRKDVVLVEGVFDALVLPDRTVASFGKRLTAEQCVLLRRAGIRTVTVAFDSDATSDAYTACRRLFTYGGFDSIRRASLPEGEDPSSLGREAFLKVVDSAEPVRV
jgi:DNA primase